MSQRFLLTPLSLAVAISSASGAVWANEPELSNVSDTLVVTAPPMVEPLVVLTDPKAPRQPLPAHDGADLLKSVPGFSVIRKGGSDGDPVFRGMAASRLGILLDGAVTLGGCGMRMDPPTAYVFPESFDEVRILKGPQSVRHGAGNSAGVVLFERHDPELTDFEAHGEGSVLQGSADRNDQMASVMAGNQTGYIKLGGTRADANNYTDGAGNDVHSAYTRWSGDLTLGWTPTEDTRIELSGGVSDGEARYADRSMDGAMFEREHMAVRFNQKNLTPILETLEVRAYQNDVDHVMDNYSLRKNAGKRMVKNPDRATDGASVVATLGLDSGELVVGADWQANEHRLRKASAMGMNPDYRSLSRTADMEFETLGVFFEHEADWSEKATLHTGLRVNQDSAKDLRSGRDTNGDTDDQNLMSGFVRYEEQMSYSHRWYLGLGHTERAADYWERTRNPAAVNMMQTGAASTFDLNPEKTTQLDVGMVHRGVDTQGSVSAFYARHADFIEISTRPDVSAFAIQAENVDAVTWGLEADARYQFLPQWSVMSSLAWVRGYNLSEHRPLGQIPPLEMRVGLNYDQKSWSAGLLWRGVAEQNRSVAGVGNIVGQDIGDSRDFHVLSLNAAWRFSPDTRLTAGVDNLFDAAYAEHISRGGAEISGYETTERINEPGRTVWMKLQSRF
ncbi:MAG: TonB-dependent copper receptor [Oceanobacter sp.]